MLIGLTLNLTVTSIPETDDQRSEGSELHKVKKLKKK